MKRFSLVCLVIALSVLLSACGKNSSETQNDKKIEAAEGSKGDKDESKEGYISMPQSKDDYLKSNKKIDKVVKDFERLGFTNIEKEEVSPSDDNFEKNVFSIEITSGIFDQKDDWNAGDQFKDKSQIKIRYNSKPALTPDNSSSFRQVIMRKDSNPKSFAEDENGKYVIFDGYVLDNTSSATGGDRIITVSGGDYSKDKDGPHIWIGTRGDSYIDRSVEAGDNVTITGKISASWTKYYNMLYVETISLEKR